MQAFYNDAGISNDRILIKLASTAGGHLTASNGWKEASRKAQRPDAAGFLAALRRVRVRRSTVYVLPFVGRILDWYKANTDKRGRCAES